MRRILSTLVLFLFVLLVAQSQVTLDFSTNTTANWQIELDGDISYDATNGNPGGCLRVDDDASGVTNLLVGPYDLLGDWSMTDTSDFISFDYLVHLINGSPIGNYDFFIEISGPAGSAKALMNYVYDSLDVWEDIIVKLDPMNWHDINGEWNEILMQVDLVRIRSEFISGDEYFLLDNVELSFSPLQSAIEGQVCSTFETLDGWSFVNVASASINSFGFPNNSVRLGDQLGPSAIGFAPPKFRGDWTSLDSTDQVKCDIFISTSDPDVISTLDFIVISGNGNQAKIVITESEIDRAYNQWYRYSFPVKESAWQMVSGTWSDLIEEVQRIQLGLEFIIGSEVVYFDNFCVGDDSCPKSLVLYGQAIDSILRAQDFIILDSVHLSDQAIISAPEVLLRNNTQSMLGNEVEINSDGCN